MSRGTGRVLVSAHRGGAAGDPLENTAAAIEAAVATGAEFVELDVRRCRDGTLVLSHEAWVLLGGQRRQLSDLVADEFRAAAPDALRYDDALGLLAGRAGVHLDLKLRSPTTAYESPESTVEVAATSLAVELLGAEHVVVTTGSVRGIRAVRDWSEAQGLELAAALSVGGSVAGRAPREQLRLRLEELFPGSRFTAARATAVAANHWLAAMTLARFARRAGLPLLVWTVDHPLLLRWWLRPGRAWMVTTNRPELALAIRDG